MLNSLLCEIFRDILFIFPILIAVIQCLKQQWFTAWHSSDSVLETIVIQCLKQQWFSAWHSCDSVLETIQSDNSFLFPKNTFLIFIFYIFYLLFYCCFYQYIFFLLKYCKCKKLFMFIFSRIRFHVGFI